MELKILDKIIQDVSETLACLKFELSEIFGFQCNRIPFQDGKTDKDIDIHHNRVMLCSNISCCDRCEFGEDIRT